MLMKQGNFMAHQLMRLPAITDNVQNYENLASGKEKEKKLWVKKISSWKIYTHAL